MLSVKMWVGSCWTVLIREPGGPHIKASIANVKLGVSTCFLLGLGKKGTPKVGGERLGCQRRKDKEIERLVTHPLCTEQHRQYHKKPQCKLHLFELGTCDRKSL